MIYIDVCVCVCVCVKTATDTKQYSGELTTEVSGHGPNDFFNVCAFVHACVVREGMVMGEGGGYSVCIISA